MSAGLIFYVGLWVLVAAVVFALGVAIAYCAWAAFRNWKDKDYINTAAALFVAMLLSGVLLVFLGLSWRGLS